MNEVVEEEEEGLQGYIFYNLTIINHYFESNHPAGGDMYMRVPEIQRYAIMIE